MISVGQTSSEAVVNTYIEGSGSVYTYIETEVNGEKKVLEATGPGEYKLEMKASPTPTIENNDQEKSFLVSLTSQFIQFIKNFLSRLF